MQIKTVIKKIVLWLVVAAVALSASELLLRVLPTDVKSPPRMQFDNADGIGVVHPKNIRFYNSSECSGSVIYSTNSWGMRDRERPLKKEGGVFRVAMIGDSMLEAEQVNDTEVVNRVLEDKFGGKVEFLNFGMNSLGPTQYALLYENKIRKFKPDLVLMMFFPENDVANSSLLLEKIAYGGELFLTYRNERGQPFNPVNFTFQKSVKQFLTRNFATFRLLKQINSTLKYSSPNESGEPIKATETTLSEKELLSLREKRGVLVHNEVFIVPPDKQWEEAWSQTEAELARLKKMVEADGSRLVVVLTPSLAELNPLTSTTIADNVFKAVQKNRSIDIFYPDKRMKKLLADNNFLFFDLFPIMQEYIKKNNLAFPYFSLGCDFHWSKFGHEIVANELSGWLKRGIDNNNFDFLLQNK